MPHMIGYLGGDSDTLAARRAVDNDLRLAVEFPDERKMLVICVMQTGEILMDWTDIAVGHGGRASNMHIVGVLAEQNDGTHQLHTRTKTTDLTNPVTFIQGGRIR